VNSTQIHTNEVVIQSNDISQIHTPKLEGTPREKEKKAVKINKVSKYETINKDLIAIESNTW